jgi:hypothetical protein
VTTFVGEIPKHEQALKYSGRLQCVAYVGIAWATPEIVMELDRVGFAIRSPGGGIVTTDVTVVVLYCR